MSLGVPMEFPIVRFPTLLFCFDQLDVPAMTRPLTRLSPSYCLIIIIKVLLASSFHEHAETHHKIIYTISLYLQGYSKETHR